MEEAWTIEDPGKSLCSGCCRSCCRSVLLAGHPLRQAQAIATPDPAAQTASVQNAANPPTAGTVILDRVVAVVGETAILASDVDEEMRFAVLQPEKEPATDNTPQRALDRLIDRTLIDQQRILQPGLADVSQQQVDGAIEKLRHTIPACEHFDCKTDAGWQAFWSRMSSRSRRCRSTSANDWKS